MVGRERRGIDRKEKRGKREMGTRKNREKGREG